MHCPSCGSLSLAAQGPKAYACTQCAFTYFHNTASAVLAVITYDNEVLVAVRGREPGKGQLDLPGGFVDYDESLETALCRELQEELNITLSPEQLRYVGSAPNTYRYRDIEYKTCDVFFHIALTQRPDVQAGDDVAALKWVTAGNLNAEDFAFPSATLALQRVGLLKSVC